ncbi:aldehyde dehydrogenase (NAD+) [Thalassobacillus cyri]|uniref:Aldehyde dehydrogenase (NAD+) n=2 Tax=Thalassobacillus cyri TaxID=571932 RepID=A0A1H4E392_9BACI|nr:aldehyde dehydrogenase family protein [Thalassobacillus cyri]SEA79524.1 aldehyde dehydrogenase (NAD+) [Thalassobacillus cyri]
MKKSHALYIGGEWRDSLSKETLETRNPANQELLAEVPRGKAEDMEVAVTTARKTFESLEWQEFPVEVRGRILYDIAAKLRRDAEEIAQMETLDTGKPISQGRNDVEASARYFEYYAGMADKIFGETIPVRHDILDYTVREPVGVTAHIIPWNYPLQITSRSTAAAIATGNTVVVKPAEDTPLTALKLAELFAETELPKGVFNVVTGYGYEAGAALINHPEVNHITFTGSVQTGMAVMEAAAKNIVPVTLELGGKSPNIVFEDCDMDNTADWVVKSVVQNAGQTCSAGSRLLVQKTVKEEFLQKVKERMLAVTLGKGVDDPDLGPVLSEKQYERIEKFMQTAREEGAQFVCGGERVSVEGCKDGYYFAPTIIDNVRVDSEVAQEEIFGPVLSVFTFEDEEEAVKLGNNTQYGLVTGVWTENIGRAHRLAKRIRAGQVFINNYGAGGGVQMPFGGYKKSGFGREKGLEALRNYTVLKNVAVKM